MEQKQPENLGGYKIVGLLGKGGMGEVYKAMDPATRGICALKVMIPSAASDIENRRRFIREARSILELKHENVIEIFKTGEDGDIPYIAMEFIDGESLERLISLSGGLQVARALEIIRDSARGLKAAHDIGIVHRDVKPSNIIITNKGIVKILDFGLAKVFNDSDATQLTATGIIMGTPKYISPEQAKGEKIDQRTDIYSLGVTLFQCLTGKIPYDGSTPMEIVIKHIQAPVPVLAQYMQVPHEALGGLVNAMMHKNKELRLQTMKDVIDRIDEVLNILKTLPAASATQAFGATVSFGASGNFSAPVGQPSWPSATPEVPRGVVASGGAVQHGVRTPSQGSGQSYFSSGSHGQTREESSVTGTIVKTVLAAVALGAISFWLATGKIPKDFNTVRNAVEAWRAKSSVTGSVSPKGTSSPKSSAGHDFTPDPSASHGGAGATITYDFAASAGSSDCLGWQGKLFDNSNEYLQDVPLHSKGGWISIPYNALAWSPSVTPGTFEILFDVISPGSSFGMSFSTDGRSRRSGYHFETRGGQFYLYRKDELLITDIIGLDPKMAHRVKITVSRGLLSISVDGSDTVSFPDAQQINHPGRNRMALWGPNDSSAGPNQFGMVRISF